MSAITSKRSVRLILQHIFAAAAPASDNGNQFIIKFLITKHFHFYIIAIEGTNGGPTTHAPTFFIVWAYNNLWREIDKIYWTHTRWKFREEITLELSLDVLGTIYVSSALAITIFISHSNNFFGLWKMVSTSSHSLSLLTLSLSLLQFFNILAFHVFPTMRAM